MEMNQVTPASSTEPAPYAASGLPGQSSTLVDMLHRIDELDVIPQLQVAEGSGAHNSGTDVNVEVVSNSTHGHCYIHLPTQIHAITQATTATSAIPATVSGLPSSAMLANTHQIHPQCLHDSSTHTSVIQSSTQTDLQTDTQADNDKHFPRVGRPRTRPPRERHEWHYHLGGVRHCRVPLNADLKEVLEVAYVSRIMSKNFRKEGQPEKERIAKITGMDIDKVQEWFKNRRKKDRLLQERAMGRNLPKCHHNRKSTTSESSTVEQTGNSNSRVQGAAAQGDVSGEGNTADGSVSLFHDSSNVGLHVSSSTTPNTFMIQP